MKHDIILAGVGGQGILTIAYLLDSAAIARGLRFKQAEVHGMAQRGGAVYSHMRLSDGPVHSDLVPSGAADMVLSLEPLEVQRYVHYLSPTGVVVTNDQPYKNIPDYPADAEIVASLAALPRCVVIDAKAICDQAGASKAQNVAMVGAACPFLPFVPADFEPILAAQFGRKGEHVVQANLAVLDAGWRAGSLSKALLEAGVTSALTAALVRKLDPATVDPGLAGAFAEALKAPGAQARLDAIEGRVACEAGLVARISG